MTDKKEYFLPTVIQPAFNTDSINVCFSSDNNYAPYLAVVISSIIAHANPAKKYDICILHTKINSVNIKKIKSMAVKNISIRFVNIIDFLSEVDTSIFYIKDRFSIEAYFRFFIPQICANYNKILYIDCDTVLATDIADLFNLDLNGKSIGATLSYGTIRRLFMKESGLYNYLKNILHLDDPEKYFIDGVLLLDIKKLKDMDFTQKCLDMLNKIPNPMNVDQCIINAVFNGDILYFDDKWNTEWHIPLIDKEYTNHFPVCILKKYQSSLNNPNLIHYSSSIKPWNTPSAPLADIWWKYARLTPFYEEILFKNQNNIAQNKAPQINTKMIKEALKKNALKRKYLKYKILSKITVGSKRKKYKKKRKEMKARLRGIKKFLRG